MIVYYIIFVVNYSHSVYYSISKYSCLDKQFVVNIIEFCPHPTFMLQRDFSRTTNTSWEPTRTCETSHIIPDSSLCLEKTTENTSSSRIHS